MSTNTTSQINQYKISTARQFLKSCNKYKGLLFLLVPSLIWYILFKYYPMYGIVIAFKNYRVLDGLLGSPWAGFVNFQRLFSGSQFLEVFRNTLLISLYKIIFGFPAPIIFALLLNEIRANKFKRIVQTVTYLPHFISWVVIGGIIQQLLSPTSGIFNYVLQLIGKQPINFMTEPNMFRSIVTTSSIWKDLGWGSIVYMAAIAGINPEIYEAASVDGASRLRAAVSITIPSILPVISILFILRIGHIMEAGFDEVFNLYNPVVYRTGDIIDTYSYRVGLIDFDYSYSTAIALFKNIVGLVLLIVTNKAVKLMGEGGIW